MVCAFGRPVSGGARWWQIHLRFALFDEATLKVGNHKLFTIVAHNNSDKNIYIQSAKLNGNEYTRSYIDFVDIIRGGTLEFEMGDKPSNSEPRRKTDRKNAQCIMHNCADAINRLSNG